MNFSHADILEVWDTNGRQNEPVLNWVIEKLNKYSLTDSKMKEVKKQLHNVITYVKRNFPKCGRHLGRFKKSHPKWLSSNMIIMIQRKDFKNQQFSKMGRPTLSYEEGGSRLKRKIANELSNSQNHNTSLLVHAASISAKKTKNNDVGLMLKEAVKGSENIDTIKKNCYCQSHFL